MFVAEVSVTEYEDASVLLRTRCKREGKKHRNRGRGKKGRIAEGKKGSKSEQEKHRIKERKPKGKTNKQTNKQTNKGNKWLIYED